MAMLKFPIAWFHLSIVFLAPPTQFWCAPPKNSHIDTKKWLNDTTPKSPINHEGLNVGYCEMVNGNETLPCVYGYEYNRTIFHSSIITEWDLVCGHQRLIDISQVTLMLGVIIGNVVFGILADRKGRKNVLTVCILLQSIFGFVCAWIPWYWGYILARLFVGVFNGGTIVTSFVMCMEVVGGKWRTIVPILYQIPFGFGNSIMSGIAYLLRDWRQLQMAISTLSAFYIVYYFLISESPRWLIAVGRREEAIAILQNASKSNKRDPEVVTRAMADITNANTPTPQNPKSTFSALFCTPVLRKRSYLLCLNWTIAGITFYAFSQYLGHVTQNLYMTVALGGLIALPGTFLCIYILSVCGRRITIAGGFTCTGLCFLAILGVPKGMFIHDWPRMACAGLGIMGLSISMSAMYLFTGELFPTVNRNAGVGATVMFSRIGSMIAPLVIALEGSSQYLPLIFLGCASLLEAIIILQLPETKGQPLPETIEDVQKRNKSAKLRDVM
ncbi:organic cation transporter protein isoform X2 [Aethina tumida]|nr:organic cation transporter protein isoform X2 [Aethina tumida]